MYHNQIKNVNSQVCRANFDLLKINQNIDQTEQVFTFDTGLQQIPIRAIIKLQDLKFSFMLFLFVVYLAFVYVLGFTHART